MEEYRAVLAGEGGGGGGAVADGAPRAVAHRGADGRVARLRVTPPQYAAFLDAREAAAAQLRAALGGLAELEWRALVTGDAADVRAYMEAAQACEAPAGALRALDAMAAKATGPDVAAARAAAAERVRAASARVAELMAEGTPAAARAGALPEAVQARRSARAALAAISQPPPSVLRVVRREPRVEKDTPARGGGGGGSDAARASAVRVPLAVALARVRAAVLERSSG